jgi:hypothetical protein
MIPNPAIASVPQTRRIAMSSLSSVPVYKAAPHAPITAQRATW